MNIMKVLRKHQIITYIILTFLLTWVFWGIAYVNPEGRYDPIVHQSRFLHVIMLGGVMPCIVSIFMIGIFDGKNGVKNLLKRLIIWKVNPLYYIFVLFFTVFIVYAPLWICTSTGSHYRFYTYNNIPLLIVSFIQTALYEGPLGEEMGWRGFVLSKLQKRYNSITSSIILGVVWGSWHLPLFFIKGDTHYRTPFILFLIIVIYLSILYTWVYNSTKGSLLLVSLFHGAYNTTLGYIFGRVTPYFVKELNRYTVIMAILLMVVLLVVIRNMCQSKKIAIEVEGL